MEQTIKFVVGQPSPYVTVDANNVVHIKAQNELNMKFKKEMTIQLFDASTGAPIVENGMQVCHKVEVEDGKRQSVFLTARGYLPKTINIDSTAIPGAKGTMSQSLQKEKKNGGWNDDFGGDEHEEYLRVRKKPLIITTLALALITLIVGFAIGFALQRYVLASDTLATAKVAGDSTQVQYVKEINSLQDSISQLGKKNQKLEEDIKNKEAEIDKLKKLLGISSANQRANAAEEKALRYLNEKKSWSIKDMKQYVGDNDNCKNTTGYKFLQKLLQADKLDESILDAIIQQTRITNSQWRNIAKLLQDRKDDGASIEGFQTAFKNANKAYNSDRKELYDGMTYEQGTINLNDLQKNIQKYAK
jgi:uncharacterized protein YoxC